MVDTYFRAAPALMEALIPRKGGDRVSTPEVYPNELREPRSVLSWRRASHAVKLARSTYYAAKTAGLAAGAP